MNVQRFGGLEDISWRDFGAMVQNTMLGLHALAINKGDNIAIVGATTVCPGYASTWGHWLEGCRTW